MDDEVRRLERAARTNPFSGTIARDYERALRRAGHRETLRLFYAARLVCPDRFEDGLPTADPLVRRCRRCGPVAYPWERRRPHAGEAIAVERAILPYLIQDLVEVPRLAALPRLHATDLGHVELDEVELPREVLDLLPRETARSYLALPVEQTPEALYLALGDPSTQGIFRDLQAFTDREVRQVLAPREAVERALDTALVEAVLCGSMCFETPGPARLVQRHAPPLRDGRRTRVEDDGWLGD